MKVTDGEKPVDLLGPQGREVLKKLDRASTLIGLDYDGTITPIVRDPMAAVLSDETKAILKNLMKKWQVVIISGRMRRDLGLLLQQDDLFVTVGSHGAECTLRKPHEEYEEEVKELVSKWEALFLDLKQRYPKLILENKGLSFTVHFGMVDEQREVESEIDDRLEALEGNARIIKGYHVVNLVPAMLPHKGEALVWLMGHYKKQHALFFGDDITDEFVFKMQNPNITGVRVGEGVSTSAPYYVKNVDDVIASLKLLL
ncbi:MAG: trehalose-phosphatase [Bdellovibrionales bacterium CG10_big_fil_rev_8_21_14_0_10_45_34]|nr:MAG: trehalose-phosphatase [Bdellovibrionales bacterium CG10_big_fil_rev_8_21_14_0_10_45_34]